MRILRGLASYPPDLRPCVAALGAFDGADRSDALDMLGFKKQLVFATHSVAMPFSPSSKIDPVLRYAATRAHNRHMAQFCAADRRLLGVAIVPRWTSRMATRGVRFIRLAASDMNKLPLAAAFTRGTRDPVRDDVLEMLKADLPRYAREA